MPIVLTAFSIAIIAIVFCDVLSEPEELLAGYHRLIEKLPWYIHKPLGGCAKCFGGQIALWYNLGMDWDKHLLLICLTILILDIYDRITNR